jgi:hypothetical protein
MAIIRGHLWLSGCCSIFLLCSFAASGEDPGGLDPELREELRRGIEKRYADADSELKRDILRKIEKSPKLRCTIEAVTVYTDGIVYRAALRCDLPHDCRVSIVGRSLFLVGRAQLLDALKKEWDIPPLKLHYEWAPLEESFTILVPKGKTVTITEVNTLESPRLIPLNPPADGKTEKPSELSYMIHNYGSAYTTDLKKRENVYFMGRGKTPVEWKDSPVPEEEKTGVVKTQSKKP